MVDTVVIGWPKASSPLAMSRSTSARIVRNVDALGIYLSQQFIESLPALDTPLSLVRHGYGEPGAALLNEVRRTGSSSKPPGPWTRRFAPVRQRRRNGWSDVLKPLPFLRRFL